MLLSGTSLMPFCIVWFLYSQLTVLKCHKFMQMKNYKWSYLSQQKIVLDLITDFDQTRFCQLIFALTPRKLDWVVVVDLVLKYQALALSRQLADKFTLNTFYQTGWQFNTQHVGLDNEYCMPIIVSSLKPARIIWAARSFAVNLWKKKPICFCIQ